MNYLSTNEMEKLNTKRLLAYKTKLMKANDGPDRDAVAADNFNKAHPDWQAAYENVKTVLNTREHVE